MGEREGPAACEAAVRSNAMNTWVCIAGTAAALAGVPCTVSAQPLDPTARQAIEAGDWPGAVNAIRAAVKAKPEGESAFWLAVALGEKGEPAAVTRVIEPLWDAGPLDRAMTIAMFRYASVGWIRSFSNADFHHALFDEEACCELISARARAIRNLLADDPPIIDGANTEADRLVDAWDRLLLITEAPPPETARLAGFALLYRGHAARAIAVLAAAAERTPESWDLWLDLATAHCAVRDMESARACYERARELAPAQESNSRGGMSRRSACGLAWAKALKKAGYLSEAVETYKLIIKEQGAAEGVRHMLGETAYAVGDLGLAVWAFSDSLEIDGVAESAAGLARCWQDMGNPVLAKASIERAVSMMKAQERKVPGEVELLHAQILWESGDREAALLRYEAAYKAAPRDMDIARGAYQAFLAADDVYGALDVCRSVGANGGHDEAMEGVQEVLRRWPTPRIKDMARQKPMSHVGTAQFLMADVCWWSDRPREAVEYLRLARGLNLPRTAANASWMLLAAGDLKEAARTANEATTLYSKDAYWADHNRLALAVVRAHEGKWEEAVKAVEGVKNEAAVRRASVLRYYAAMKSGSLGKEKPDLFCALGMIDQALHGDSSGIEALTLLPGSPLLTGSIPLRRRDRVYFIEGTGRIGSAESVKTLRAAPFPGQPVKVWFVRDKETHISIVTIPPPPGVPPPAPAAGAKGGGN